MIVHAAVTSTLTIACSNVFVVVINYVTLGMLHVVSKFLINVSTPLYMYSIKFPVPVYLA